MLVMIQLLLPHKQYNYRRANALYIINSYTIRKHKTGLTSLTCLIEPLLLSKVVDPDSDFLSSSIVATFADGSAETTATAILNNDNNPEGNETFTMTLVAVNSNFGATLGTPASLEITVRANDDPHGVLQFDSVCH